jgi:hypothetical protein
VLRELIFDLAADGVAPVAAQSVILAERVPGQVGRAMLAHLPPDDHCRRSKREVRNGEW